MKLDDAGLETAALRFIPLDKSHRDLVLNSGVEEAVWRWMPAVKSGAGFEQYVDAMIAAQGKGIYTTFLLYDHAGAFKGIAGFTDTNRQHRRTRIALTWFPPEIFEPYLFQSAQLGLIQRALDWGARRIEWRLNPANSFMMTHVESLGAVLEARMRNYERLADGTWADKAVFSMLRPEMADKIKALEATLSPPQ